jgi:hypothetical protein
VDEHHSNLNQTYEEERINEESSQDKVPTANKSTFDRTSMPPVFT